MKLLLTGDLHLGRTSTRLPRSKREVGRAVSGWDRLVDAALREEVTAVVLSGDVLDEKNKFWEAVGPFRSGVERLAAQGIRTIAVAGNHDADALPRLAATLPREQFTLLGENGTWERITLEENDTPVLHLDGWSFPSASHRQDPTRSYPEFPSDSIPVLGVVHGDPGVPDSPYAPLSLSHLQSLSVDGWLLGHIHKPTYTPGSPWVLMPGSPQPLDPGEPDAHHAWLIEIQNGTLTKPVPCCPASLLYRTVEIPLTPEDTPTLDFLHSQLRDAVASADTDAFQILRIRFTGQTGSAKELEELTEALTDWEDPSACIEQVRIDTLPALNHESLQDAGPVPAKLIHALDTLPSDLEELLQDTLRHLAHQKEFTSHGLSDFTLDDFQVNTLLEKTLRAALESAE